MYHFLVNLFRYIRWLSLDIALGGAILLLHVSKSLYQLEVPYAVVCLLSIAILLIYTSDHLLDARRILTPSMPRHLFHQRHQTTLFFYLLLLALIGVVILFVVDPVILLVGGMLTGCCVLYLMLSLALARKGSKEMVVAVVYASAMFLFPFVRVDLELIDGLYWLQLFLIAFSNLIIISYYEYRMDTLDKTTSIAHVLGVHTVRRLSLLLIMINILIAISLLVSADFSYYQVFVLLANLVLFTVLMLGRIFEKNERYRFASDAVFFIPIFFL